jgi:hypothetical protein
MVPFDCHQTQARWLDEERPIELSQKLLTQGLKEETFECLKVDLNDSIQVRQIRAHYARIPCIN